MSIEYCHDHNHFYDTDWVEDCKYCFEEESDVKEEPECKHCQAPNVSYKCFCSKSCYLYDNE